MDPPPETDFSTFFNVINNKLCTSVQIAHGINPANLQRNPDVPVCTQGDLDDAVKYAQRAHLDWSKSSSQKRRDNLHAFGDDLADHLEDFVKLLTKEQGKPHAQARVELTMSVKWLKELCEIQLPETVIIDNDDSRVTERYVPLGVVAGIVPWNFPVLLAIGKIASAVYTGNSIIIKPSPFTPYCALKLGELAAKIFPPGLIQVLNGDDSLGPWITKHPGIDKISFTGSTETGKLVLASSAGTIKRVTLELGGNDPAIVCEDVEIDDIVPKLATLCFLNSSQVCMMIKRLYIHEKIYDRFRAALVEYTASLKVGDGSEPGTFFGPIQNTMQFAKLKDLLSSAKSEGLNHALGGTITESEGLYIHPTIVDNPPETSRVVQEEPFGPIVPLLKWSEEEDVIKRANSTKTGLGASVWSKNPKRAEEIGKQLQAGTVWINSHFEVAPNVSIGGHKWSGIGSEWGMSGLVSYCNLQTLWHKKK